MACSHNESKNNSGHTANDTRNEAKVLEVEDAKYAAKVDLFEALISVDKPAIEAVLQIHPGLVNFEYKTLGTPLQIICSRYNPSNGVTGTLF